MKHSLIIVKHRETLKHSSFDATISALSALIWVLDAAIPALGMATLVPANFGIGITTDV